VPGRIFDGFPYNGERELLDLRMRELDGIVDGHVLVQSDRNFRGEERAWPAPAGLAEEYPGRLKIVALRPPPGPHPTTDFYQRAQIGRALMVWDPQPGDVLLLSDVDEIPARAPLIRLKLSPPQYAVCLLQKLYYYSVTWLQKQTWLGTVAWRHDGVAYDTQMVRERRGEYQRIADGGWHFSYFGSPQRIARKASSRCWRCR